MPNVKKRNNKEENRRCRIKQRKISAKNRFRIYFGVSIK
jgi:hypothetical protein